MPLLKSQDLMSKSMILSLQKISPVFLKSDSSDVWNKAIEFQDQNILITAPSGTGKTSLFNILYLIDQNFEGQYALNEKEAKTHTKTEIASIRKGITKSGKSYKNISPLERPLNIKEKLDPSFANLSSADKKWMEVMKKNEEIKELRKQHYKKDN